MHGDVMAKKTFVTFDLGRIPGKNPKASTFERIVREIDTKEIPHNYVDQVIISYLDGNVVKLDGNDLSHPISSKTIKWDIMDDIFKKMKDVKVVLDLDKIEADVNIMVEKYLGRHC